MIDEVGQQDRNDQQPAGPISQRATRALVLRNVAQSDNIKREREGRPNGETGDTFIVFEVNGLHNLSHIFFGLVFVIGARSPKTSQVVNFALGVIFIALAVLGFLNLLVEDLLSTNAADDFLHLVTGVVALYFGVASTGVHAEAV